MPALLLFMLALTEFARYTTIAFCLWLAFQAWHDAIGFSICMGPIVFLLAIGGRTFQYNMPENGDNKHG